uniref:Uncharacterized protein n=1 Tax=Arundo donax TaxID=35708 RepID=A0A0A8XZ58_ARUDO
MDRQNIQGSSHRRSRAGEVLSRTKFEQVHYCPRRFKLMFSFLKK